MQLPTSNFLQMGYDNNLAATLAAGGSLTVPVATWQDVHALQSSIASPEHLALVLPSSGLKFTQQQQLTAGIGTGAMTGAGLALLAETLRMVAPNYGVLFTLGSILVGGGLGGAIGGGLISVTYNAKDESFTLKAATAAT